jgi:hypothetical protein
VEANIKTPGTADLKKMRTNYTKIKFLAAMMNLLSEECKNIEKICDTQYKNIADQVDVSEVNEILSDHKDWSYWTVNASCAPGATELKSWYELTAEEESIKAIGGLAALGYPVKKDTPHTLLRRISSTPTEHDTSIPHKVCGVDFRIPECDDLDELPIAIRYFGGNDSYPSGFYIRLDKEITARLPLVPVVPENVNHCKQKTMKCTNPECNDWRCNFTHAEAPYFKVGMRARCPSNPGFGNPDTFEEDCRTITPEDARKVLMYGLSDVLAASVYLQNSPGSKILPDLDICENE